MNSDKFALTKDDVYRITSCLMERRKIYRRRLKKHETSPSVNWSIRPGVHFDAIRHYRDEIAAYDRLLDDLYTYEELEFGESGR